MSKSTIVLNTLLDLWNQNADAFNGLPEFNFVPPLASKLKAKGCSCGMGNEIAEATSAFNLVVQNLNSEQVARIRGVLGRESLIFGIQTANGFDIKDYS